MTEFARRPGWDASAEAWIAEMGETGDFGRRAVLDPVMLARVQAAPVGLALDVGCGEGRFCRMLAGLGVDAIGLDPTVKLLEEARRRDPGGRYVRGRAEALPFSDAAFDLVLSYLTLIDIEGWRGALAEMVRVLRPGGRLLIANIASFATARVHAPPPGEAFRFIIDHYLEERAVRAAWRGIDVINWHRPLGAYLGALLGLGLRLDYFAEPEPLETDSERAERYRRVPYFYVMEWRRDEAGQVGLPLR